MLLAGCEDGRLGKCDVEPCTFPKFPCTADADCFHSEFCDFPNNSCGASEEGVCSKRPTQGECLDVVQFVCGCDGVSHRTACIAARDGTDVQFGGVCPIPADGFACGVGSVCLRYEQACIEQTDGAGNATFVCTRFGGKCEFEVECSCLLESGCDQCTDENGVFRARC